MICPVYCSSIDNITISKYSSLDERVQKVALEAIVSINESTSTDPRKNWSDYTATILSRLDVCKNAKNTLFVALEVDQVVGYAAFYTRQDLCSYSNQFLEGEDEAYCSWIAVHEQYKGKALGFRLQTEIFKPEHGISTFKGHMKKTNEAAKKLLKKIADDTKFIVSQENLSSQIYYTVRSVELSST